MSKRGTLEYKAERNAHMKKYRKNSAEIVHAADKKTYDRRFYDALVFLRRLFTQAKSRAKVRKIEWTITLDDLIMPTFCPILGIKLQIKQGTRRDNKPSLDRIDNSKGYIKGNVYIISGRANRIKSDATAEELLLIAQYASEGNKA